jgi:putative acyl-CoA dehydrogenase
LQAGNPQEADGRRIARQLVLLVQGMLLTESAPQYLAEAFISSRLGGAGGVFGAAMPPLAEAHAGEILARAWPA